MHKKTDVKKRTQVLSGMIVFILLIVMGKFIYDSYHLYRNTIVEQQQQHLLTIAQSLKRSLEMYFLDEINKLEIIEESNGLYKELLIAPSEDADREFKEVIKPLYAKWDLIGIYIVDTQGKVKFKDTLLDGDEDYLEAESDFSKQSVLTQDKIRQAYQYDKSDFVIPIVHPIYKEEEYLGAFIGIVNLETVYNKLIVSTRVGEQGYVMVKDSNGNIIMHPAKDQIGKNIVKDRKKQFPEFYFEDLERLEISQYTEDEGVAEYYSYWWNQMPPKKIKKISSFTRIDLAGTFWVLAVVMDYSEIVAPIQGNLIRLLSFAFVVFIMIMVTSIVFIRLKRKQEDLIVETEYLKNINYTLEELQVSEKKIMEYQKLQTIGTFTGGIAHELNNLLTPILGYSQLAAYTMSTEHEYYEDMKEISDAALQAKELIQQISLLSRKERLGGKNELIDISKEISKGVRMVEAAKEDNIKVVKDIQMDCGYIQGSTTHIQQILMNLSNNACQAMKEKGGVLTVRLRQLENKEEQQKYISLIVEDTGCGIKEDLIDRVYDPFFTTKEIGEGTGIGLSIVQSIVRDYKGSICVESEEDKGSRFKVILPITEIEVNEIQQPKENYNLEKKLKILLVEDNVQVIKFLKKSLTNMGYRVTLRTDPLEALELFKQAPFEYNLIITDYAMPNLTGTKLINEIKNIRLDIKVILVTGVVEKEVVDQIKQHIIDDFIIKPIEYNDLSRKIYRLFSEERG